MFDKMIDLVLIKLFQNYFLGILDEPKPEYLPGKTRLKLKK